MSDDEMTMTVSITWEVNFGNCESVDVLILVSGITRDTTEEQIQSMLENKVAWEALRADINAKTKLVCGKGFFV